MSKVSGRGASCPGFCFPAIEFLLFIRGSPSGLDFGLCNMGGKRPRLALYSFFVMATAGKFRLNEVLKKKMIYKMNFMLPDNCKYSIHENPMQSTKTLQNELANIQLMSKMKENYVQ